MGSDLKIIWSQKARTTFYLVLDYLDKNWTKKEMLQFFNRTELTINAIRNNPSLFPASTKNPTIRKAVVDKNNSLYYKIDFYKKEIYLLTFFDSRQDPQKLTL